MLNKISLIVFILLFFFQDSNSQSKTDLERQRRETQEIIENTTRLLEQTSRTRQNSLEQLAIVASRLQLRKNLIEAIESEIRFLDNSVLSRRKRIVVLEDELKESRAAYARLINSAYKHRLSHQRMMFILSASDFNQAYRRLKYLQQYSESRQKQIKKIETLTEEIAREIETIELQRVEKIGLLRQQQDESITLNHELQQQNSIIRNLRQQESKLKNQLAEQEKVARKLQEAIEEMLREEAKIAAEKKIYELTPAEKIISDQFQLNKGGLPWPTERGVVTSFFGEHPHPVLRGIKVQNNGIDISTTENAEVMALFDGVVTQVRNVPGSYNVVLVRHGNYLSVYANLSHVYVRSGDVVKTRQLIGRVFTDNGDNNKSILQLQIWEENKKLDPMLWLSRQ
jgi:murein hydrolase activator